MRNISAIRLIHIYNKALISKENIIDMLSSYKFLNIKIPLSIKMSNMSHKKEINMLLSSSILSIIYVMRVQNMSI